MLFRTNCHCFSCSSRAIWWVNVAALWRVWNRQWRIISFSCKYDWNHKLVPLSKKEGIVNGFIIWIYPKAGIHDCPGALEWDLFGTCTELFRVYKSLTRADKSHSSFYNFSNMLRKLRSNREHFVSNHFGFTQPHFQVSHCNQTVSYTHLTLPTIYSV